MPTLEKYKYPLIAIVLGCALYLGYVYLWPTDGDIPLLESASSENQTQADVELLKLLARTKQIQLDSSIFENPVFISLQDFGQIIPLQPVGREDPFAPIPGAAPAKP